MTHPNKKFLPSIMLSFVLGLFIQSTSCSEQQPDSDVGKSEQTQEKVGVHPWRTELLDNMRAEDIEQTIRNFANFDDCHLAETSIGGWMSAETCAEFQSRVVVRLMRVRRLLACGRRHPQHVIPPLRQALRDSLLSWPAAFEKRKQDYANGIRSYAEPDVYLRGRKTCLAATYILAELQDHNAMPLLAHQYRIHHPWPPPVFRAPVPPAISFYAMHRLAATHPHDGLSPEAAKALDEYLAMADCIAPPDEFTATVWNADYSESDPRFSSAEEKERTLRGQTTITLPRYANQFKDGSDMQDSNGKKSKKMDALFAKLDAFVLLAYPDANLPQPKNAPANGESPSPAEPNTAEDLAEKGFPLHHPMRQKFVAQTAQQSTAEVVADLGNLIVAEVLGSNINMKAPGYAIQRYYKYAGPNIKVLRLIEEGRQNPSAVTPLLRDAVRKLLTDYDEVRQACVKSWERGEECPGTSEIDRYYNEHRRYEHPQLEFPRMNDVGYMSLYILANIGQLNRPLLADWLRKEKTWRYRCTGMEVWLVDYYFTQGGGKATEAAKRHAALTKGVEICGPNVRQSRWNAPWDVHEPLLGAADVNVRDIQTIEVLAIPPRLPDGIDKQAQEQIVQNFLDFAEHCQPVD